MPNVVLVLLSFVAIVTDALHGRVYNVVTYPAMVGGIIYHACATHPPGFTDAVAGLSVGGVALGLLYLSGDVGGGDVKLAAAVGAWVGPADVIQCLMIAAGVGGVMGVIALLRARRLIASMRGLARNIFALVTPGRKPLKYASGVRIPFGVAIGIATLLTVAGVRL